MKFNNWLITIFVILCISVYFLEGIPINPFAFWNMVPLFLGLIVVKKGIKDSSYTTKFGSVGFAVGAIILVFFAHFAWFFDWWETQTGSSTSGLIFIFIPLYAVGGSVILGLIVSIVGMIFNKK